MLTSVNSSQFGPNFTSKSVTPSINPNKQGDSTGPMKRIFGGDTFSSSSGLDSEECTALHIARIRAHQASKDVKLLDKALNMLKQSYSGSFSEYARVAVNAAIAKVMQELAARENDTKEVVEELEKTQAADFANSSIESLGSLNPIGSESKNLEPEGDAYLDSESEETDKTPDEYEKIIAEKLIESGNTVFTQEDIEKLLNEI